MDDAAQNEQNVQPAATQQKHQIHPGWFALTAVSDLGMALGAWGVSRGGKEPACATFLGVGAGLTGLSLYFAFK